LLIGIALDEGKLRSLDDLAKVYAPGLAGSAYGETSVRDLLTMSSGIRFAERYDGQDDLDRLIQGTLELKSPGGAAVLADYKERRVAPGKVFMYSSADTQALGLVLAGATGMSLADYMSSRLWAPMGAAENASYQIDAAGQEAAFAFLHATLRDFGRLGVLAAQGGMVNGRQVVPAAWLRESTSTASGHLQPFVASSYFGYGNHIWTFPGEHRRFAFIGVRGQVIFVDPELKLVLVQTAVWKTAGDRLARAELLALWRGIVEHYGPW
jgi:CubicO group peptidase (beta-lactamase class C family)